MLHSYKAIIIGSGVAGLAAAIRLAVQGFEVSVYEKNDYPGGKLSSLKIGEYTFDAGPSLFTQPQNIEELFDLAGENIKEYFQYQTIPFSCKYFYEDGTIIEASTDANAFARELDEKLGGDGNHVKKYLRESENVYTKIGRVFLDNSLQKRKVFKANIRKAFSSVKWKYLFRTLHDINATGFTKPQTIQLFDRYATYNGSSPYKAPGMLCLIPHFEFNEGLYYPLGGMISITNALYKLAKKKGVQFYFQSLVQKIIANEGKVMGVVVNNENVHADVVVGNMDVYFTYKHLLNDESKSKKILKQERSSSALVFYWCINKEFAQMQLHNIFFSKDYKTEFEYIFKSKKLCSDPTIYVNITAKCEPGVHAPLGRENWFVMINVPANCGQDWNTIKETARNNVIEKLNRLLQIDIEPLIENEETLDPVSIEKKTASYMGSLYGTSSNSRLAAFLRHPNFSKSIKGLYFVGGSVHPGGGIPLCIKSAKIMSEIVEDEKKKWKHH